MDDDKRLHLPWVAIGIILLGFYVASYGPALRLLRTGRCPELGWTVYQPLLWLTFHGPRLSQGLLKRYVASCVSEEYVEDSEILVELLERGELDAILR